MLFQVISSNILNLFVVIVVAVVIVIAVYCITSNCKLQIKTNVNNHY